MKYYFSILLLTCCLYSYSFSIGNLHIEYRETEDKYYEITLHNVSSDTLYLFDSYLKPCVDLDKYYGYFYESKYLHRYSNGTKTYKLSLIPIIGNVCHDEHNQINTGIDKVAQRSKILYSFQTLLLNSSLSIFLLNRMHLSLRNIFVTYLVIINTVI